MISQKKLIKIKTKMNLKTKIGLESITQYPITQYQYL